MSVRLWMMNMKAAGLRGHASHRNGESHTVSKPHFFPFVSQPVRPVRPVRPVEETRSNRSNRSTHRLSAAQNAEVSVRRQQTRRGVPGGSASVPLSAATFDATLKALCESKQYGKAWNLYMKHSGDWMQHLSYNSLQALLSQSLRNGNLAAAVTVFEDMKSAGYRPNKVTFSMLISGLCKQRRKGSSGFRELGYTYWKELERNHGSRLDAAALRNGMQACVGVGKLDEAEAILDTIEVLVVTSKNESSEQRRRREGAQGAQGTRRGGDRKDDRNDTGDRNDVRTYNILINGYAKERNSAGIEALFKRMLAANVRPTITTYNALVSSHVKSGRMDEAVRTVERARNAGIAPDAWTFTSLMKGHINAEDFAAAKTVWRDMIAAGVKPTPVSYSVMIDCAIQEGDMAQAQRLLDIMHAQGERPSAITFNALLRAYVVSAELRSFDASFDASFDGSDDGIANFGTANFTNTSRIPEALRVLDQMEEANVLPATDTFNMLMSAAVSAGDPYLAEDIYDRLVRTGQHANAFTYTILIQAYAKQADLPAAVAAFEKLSKDKHADLDIAAYNAMVDAFARLGEMQAAEKLLQRACNFASNAGIGPPVEAFGAVVTGYVRLKSVNAAVNTVRKFHSIGGTPDAQMLDQLVDLCVRTGEYKVAMQAVRALELVGAEVDKEKYKTFLLGKEDASTRGSRSSEDRRWDDHRDDRRDGETENSSLERFKFWLGLPNTYYR
jgi:pentatricopeptide repeat protein